jgi:8-oxo-dGTP diphosphatase
MRLDTLSNLLAPGLQAKGAQAADVGWFRVADLLQGPQLAVDHGQTLQAAVERLRSKVDYASRPAFLMPGPFSRPQLQRTDEGVLGRPVDTSGFRTRMLAADFPEDFRKQWGRSKATPIDLRWGIASRTGQRR